LEGGFKIRKEKILSYQEWLKTTNAFGHNKYEEAINRLADSRGELGDPKKWRRYFEERLREDYEEYKRDRQNLNRSS